MRKHPFTTVVTVAVVACLLMLAFAMPAEAASRPKKKEFVTQCLDRQDLREFPRAVRQWKREVAKVLYSHELPCRYLPGVLKQIRQESGGNRHAVNRYDINWINGYPSKGLIQVIRPTYLAYAHPNKRHTKYQTRPYANIWAGVNYAVARYGVGRLQAWTRGDNRAY